MLISQPSSQQHGAALVIGAGPAGMLASLLLSRHGWRVSLVEQRPALSTDRPRWQHVHAIDHDTWSSLSALTPGLAEEMTRRGAPVAHADTYCLDGDGSAPRRAFPTRRMLDEGLMAMCARDASIAMVDGERVDGGDGLAETLSGFDFLLDCSGSARATLGQLPDACAAVIIEDVTEGAHVSLRVRGVRWPAGYVGHVAQDADGVSGCLLRRGQANDTSITMLLPGGAAIPGDANQFLTILKRYPDTRVADLIKRATPVGPLCQWRSKRMSRIDFDGESLPDSWLALGDALLQTPPRLGRGLAQLSRQLELLADAIVDDQTMPDILQSLLTQAQETFEMACLAQHLWEQASRAPLQQQAVTAVAAAV